jgi:hypothetical protein
MFSNEEWELLGNLLYASDNPMAMTILDKLDNIVIEYGLGDN